MEAIDRTFKQIIDTSIQYVVPVFQRDYKWDEEQWQRLWDDVERVSSKNGNTGHFLGSLVQIDSGRTTPSLSSWLVIDGQQRLATLTILVAALRDHLEDTGWPQDEDGPTKASLEDMFLRNRNVSGDREYKLSLRRTDNATLRGIIDRKDPATVEGNPSGQIRGCYKFFRERLNAPGFDPLALYNSVASLRIVEVTLKREVDDPQFVFESMNHTGVGLSQGDLIRNYLLMNLEEKEQTRLYSDYWRATEGYFREPDGALNDELFDAFLQDYLALKLNRNRREPRHRIYDEFKRHWDVLRGKGTLEQGLQEISRFAGYYAVFRGRQAPSTERLARALRDVRRRGTTSAVLVLRLYDCFDQKKNLTEAEFVSAFALIESYLFRRAVIGLQTRWGSYYRIFSEMARDIHNMADPTPLETVERVLRSWEEWYWHWRFPKDSEFIQALETHDLYSLGGVCKNLLDRLENFDTKEPSPTSTYTIEHVMPQSPGEEWQKMLGDDWQQVHAGWLHRLGNLTLTGYNPEMSNRSFEEKKTIKGGFKEAAVRLNQFVREQPQWTATEMDLRGKQLAERALKIWPYPRAS